MAPSASRAAELATTFVTATGSAPRRAHAQEDDFLVTPQLLVIDLELAKGDEAIVGEPPAHRVGDGFRRLVNLLEHEMRESALLRLAHVPVDVDELRIDRDPVEGGDLSS